MSALRGALAAVTIAAAAIAILLDVFFRELDELFTVFILGPVFFIVWPVLLGLGVFWAVELIRGTRPRWLSLLPLAACIAAISLVALVPVEDWQIDRGFQQQRREAVIERLRRSEIESTDLVTLPPSESDLSHGGGQVFVTRIDGRDYVLFYFYRGVLDSFSGYVYVPQGGSVQAYADSQDVMVDRKLADQWYFVRGR